MGVLIPANLPLLSLRNDSERLVVEAFRDRLTDGWMVMPSVELTGHRDYEIDVVLAHASDGVVIVEVKGHQPTIRDGEWYAGGRRMEPQPFTQARSNAYALRNELRDIHPSLRHLKVEYAVAFPNVDRVSGTLPPGVDDTQVLTCRDLEDPLDPIERLVAWRAGGQPLGEDGLRHVVDRLAPNCTFDLEDEARARLARARLDDICRQQVDALAGLD